MFKPLTLVVAIAIFGLLLAKPIFAQDVHTEQDGAAIHDAMKLNVGKPSDNEVAWTDELNRKWKLVWSCEFNSPSDLKKWNVFDKWDNANNEMQAYRAKNCTVRDGMLFIEAKKMVTSDGGTEKLYTSGRIDTNRKFGMKYGRFDCRFRVPKGKGFWPAFWMLPWSGNWPPEIDWMEILGHKPEIIEVTNHYGVHSANGHPWHGPKRYELHPDFSEQFHTVTGIWNEREIVCYVDGKQISVSHEGVPHEKMYLILNLAVGGDLPGPPNESTPFPGQFVVDYVRAYKLVEK